MNGPDINSSPLSGLSAASPRHGGFRETVNPGCAPGCGELFGNGEEERRERLASHETRSPASGLMDGAIKLWQRRKSTARHGEFQRSRSLTRNLTGLGRRGQTPWRAAARGEVFRVRTGRNYTSLRLLFSLYLPAPAGSRARAPVSRPAK